VSRTPAYAFADPISAIQVSTGDDGGERLGLLTQIRPDSGIEVCGPGFNAKTVKVRFHGSLYFVFREDLERRLGSLSREKKQEVGSPGEQHWPAGSSTRTMLPDRESKTEPGIGGPGTLEGERSDSASDRVRLAARGAAAR